MEIKIGIDFNRIAQNTGVRKGKIFYSSTFNSWVVSGHHDIDLICINPPHEIGDKIKGLIVKKIEIKDNKWIFKCNKKSN